MHLHHNQNQVTPVGTNRKSCKFWMPRMDSDYQPKKSDAELLQLVPQEEQALIQSKPINQPVEEINYIQVMAQNEGIGL